MITFATFHIDCTPEAADHIATNNVYLENRNDYLEQIDLMFRSATLTHPDCKKVVLSDLHTDLSTLPADIQIHRFDLNPKTVMLSRLEAQIDYATYHDLESDIVFLDSDMLIQGNLNHVFAQNFDVGLTYREPEASSYEKMPFNGGVIFVSHACRMKALQFLKKVYTLFQAKSTSQGIWWGDQYALLEAVEPANFFDRTSEIVEVNGCKLLFVPCSLYNYAPPDRISAILSKLKDKQIIHFKGSRKRLIEPYWQIHLQQQALLKKVLHRVQSYPALLSVAFAESMLDLSRSLISSCQAFLNKALQKGRKLIIDRAN